MTAPDFDGNNACTALFTIQQSAVVPLYDKFGNDVVAWRVGRVLYVHPKRWDALKRAFSESGE